VFTGAYFIYSDEGGSTLRRKFGDNYDPTRRQKPRRLVIWTTPEKLYFL